MIVEKQPNKHQGICFCFPPQDALLRLAAVVDARSLRVALRDGVRELLPSTVMHENTHVLEFPQIITWRKGKEEEKASC